MKFVLFPFIVMFIIILDGVARFYLKPLDFMYFLVFMVLSLLFIFIFKGKVKTFQAFLLFCLLAFMLY